MPVTPATISHFAAAFCIANSASPESALLTMKNRLGVACS